MVIKIKRMHDISVQHLEVWSQEQKGRGAGNKGFTDLAIMNKTLIAKFVQKPMTSADCTVTRRVTSAVQRQPGFPQCQHQVQGRYRDAIINSEHRVIRQIQAMICSVICREWFRRIFQDQKNQKITVMEITVEFTNWFSRTQT